MQIDESKILDPRYYDERSAIACLLVAGVCGLGDGNMGTKEKPEWTTIIYVEASDIFAWGIADAEYIEYSDGESDSEIIALYKLWKENNEWGSVKWLCLKRNEQPQKPIKAKMIMANYWDETLEALPPNYFDMKCMEIYKAQQQLIKEVQEDVKNNLLKQI